MNRQKLLLATATACLLLGASGATMAEDSLCEGGFILNQTVDNVTVDGFECTIINSVINGNVIASNDARLQMLRNNVFGKIKLMGVADSFVSGNKLNEAATPANIVVDSTGSTDDATEILVSSNVIQGRGDIRFTNVGELLIYENSVQNGSITCTNSLTITEANFASGGVRCAVE